MDSSNETTALTTRGREVHYEKNDLGFACPDGCSVIENPETRSRVPEIHHNAKGERMCSGRRSSWTPSNPVLCTSTIIYPNGRCQKHGGPTPSGIGSPQFKTGRASRHLPTRLISKYQEALDDPELMGLATDLAMVDARMNDLHEQLDEGGAGKIMLEIDDAVQAFKFANEDNDRKAMRESWRRLEDAVKRGRTESSIWAELFLLRDQKRKLTLAEAKRLQITDQMVKVTQVNLLISALLDSVRKNVKDRKTLAAVSEDFNRIMNGPGPRTS